MLSVLWTGAMGNFHLDLSQCTLSLSSRHVLFCPNYFMSSQLSDVFLILYYKEKDVTLKWMGSEPKFESGFWS